MIPDPALARLGTESAFSVLARAAALTVEGRDVVNLGIGQPDFPTPPHVVAAGVRALQGGAHGYTDARGTPELREAVAADVAARHGTAIDPAHLTIMPGGKPTMFFAIQMLAQAGTEVLYPDPGFPIYRSMIEYRGARPVPVRLHPELGFGFRAAEVLAQITDATRLLIVNSPGNPTGGVVPDAEVDALAEGLRAHPHVAVLSDEIYSCLLYGGRAHRSMLAYPWLRDRLIVLDGWSKTYAMTGWRLGWALWPEALVEAAGRLCVNSFSCVNAATQAAGIAALTGPQDAVDAMREAFNARRRMLVAELNRLPGVTCAEPLGAFYAFPDVTGTGLSSRGFQERALETHGVATIAGPSFGVHGEGFVRLSYAASMADLERALERLRVMLG